LFCLGDATDVAGRVDGSGQSAAPVPLSRSYSIQM
jgi:hypothetical protein